MIDTLILGGGLAGSAAALWLSDHGHSTAIVEARPRLGGRALSRDWNGSGGPVEHGGGWIRADHELLHALAARLHIPMTPRAPITRHSHFRDGQNHTTPADDSTAYDTALTQLQSDASALADNLAAALPLHTMSLNAYFTHRAVPASLQREVLAWWSISGSGDPGQIAVTELLTPKLAKGFLIKLQELACTVSGGISTLIEQTAKASGATLYLGDPALRLHDQGDHVDLTLTSGHTLQARTALIALNLNAYTQLRFTPPLTPPQNRLSAQGHAGRALKLLIRAQGPQPGHLATGEAHGLRWIYADRTLPDGATLLVAFGLFDETAEPSHDQVAKAVAAAFPGALVTDFDWHDWCADPFARGTWVSPKLSSLPDYDPDHWAPRGNLAFAGSDLYSAEQGWFEGALLTAQAATAALHRHLIERPRP